MSHRIGARSSIHFPWALLGALLLVVAACEKKPGATTDTVGGTGTGTGTDSGTGTGTGDPPGCRSDAACAAEEYCIKATGACAPAKTCTDDGSCEPLPGDPEDYCSNFACYCDPDRGGGRCRPRVQRCQPCTADRECGTDDFVFLDYVAGCVEFDGARVCLPKGPACTPYVPQAGSEYCAPATGSCADQQLCSSDADCDATGDLPLCDRSRGRCVAVCVFDYQKGESTCPPGQVCHVDPRLLTAGNPNFGGGRCGAPCETGGYACPAGTACEEDGDRQLLQSLPRRCRPPAPKCVRNADCPADPAAHSLGYCDPSSLNCKSGCARASDCESGFKCVQGACVEKTCIENGGANIACGVGEFCCGEANSLTPCPASVNPGECYPAPADVWYGTCAAGVTVSTPSGSARPQPSRCELGKLWHACDKAVRPQCPRSHKCEAFLQFCQTDADCDGSTGSCGEFEGGVKGCVCNAGQRCPSPSACTGGKDPQDPSSQPTYCEANWCGVAQHMNDGE